MSFLHYFTDPVLFAPTVGSMLMCFAASLVGALVFLRKQSLLGEALSHAAYPGVVFGVIICGFLSFDEKSELLIAFCIMGGGGASALLGLLAITFLERKMKVASDSALCFVLSSFFGIGLTVASQVQFSYSTLYQQIQVYLYGQAATMTDIHVKIYAILSLGVLLVIIMFYKEILAIAFDRPFAKGIGVNTRAIDALTFLLIVAAVVIGIRSVGVVLMSAMLIAPAASARQFTNKLSFLFAIAAFFGLLSGFFGNYLSNELTTYYQMLAPKEQLTFPTGPMIVIVASLLCLLSLLFSPKRGLILKVLKVAHFKYRCTCENVLKALWRQNHENIAPLDSQKRKTFPHILPFYLRFILWRLKQNGSVQKTALGYTLTREGDLFACRIIRLHRLWEVYLVDYIGIGAERVHRSAEEIEHILTPEIEKELEALLKSPTYDPHQQPIPRSTLL